MQTKLIKTTDYLLLIDEEAEIKEGTKWVYDNDKPSITPLLGNTNIVKEGISKGWFNKIIAYYPLTKEAKELDLPLLPNPFEEVDINEIAKQRAIDRKWHPNSMETRRVGNEIIEAVKYGYEIAQSKQFSLEDIERVIEQTIEFMRNKATEFRNCKNIIIQSLSTQQLPKEFIPEYICGEIRCCSCTSNDYCLDKQLKTITNSEGKQEMVGVYKY